MRQGLERKPRRAVTADHPVVAAAVAVLREAGGGPMTVGEIFVRALERGLLPASSHNTIRGRLSQHAFTGAPLLERLSGRRGWSLRRGAPRPAARRGTPRRLRDVALVLDSSRGAPDALVALTRGACAAGVRPTVRWALLSDLDAASLTWLLANYPFEPRLRAALAVAKGRHGRACVFAAEETRAERAGVRVLRVDFELQQAPAARRRGGVR